MSDLERRVEELELVVDELARVVVEARVVVKMERYPEAMRAASRHLEAEREATRKRQAAQAAVLQRAVEARQEAYEAARHEGHAEATRVAGLAWEAVMREGGVLPAGRR